MSLYTPNLSFSVIYALCVHRKPVYVRFLERPARTEAGTLTLKTYVDEYHRDQKGLCKTRLFPHFLAGMLASVFPVLHSSVRLRGRQSATGAYFAGWLYWRCRIESRFRIFCPSKLSPLQPLQRRLRCAAACTKIDAGNRTAYTAKWKETAS